MKTLLEQIAAVRREIFLREQRYPHQVAALIITAAKAHHEIECMQAVLKTLKRLKKPEWLSWPKPK